jgi:hypothetical protein
VKDGVWQSVCVWKMVCDKVCVCDKVVWQSCVWKMVCVPKCVLTKMVCDKVCVKDGERRSEEEAEAEEHGIQKQKQEPHTKLWGIISCKIFLPRNCSWHRISHKHHQCPESPVRFKKLSQSNTSTPWSGRKNLIPILQTWLWTSSPVSAIANSAQLRQ